MAEFVKKGTKGAVGHLTKAEETGLVPVESLLGAAIPDGLEQITEEIKNSHKVALGQMGRAVLAAARAGELLVAAKAKLLEDKTTKKAFTVWLAETFEFSQRTAYDYITVHEKLSRRGGEIEGVTSIRDVLKLTDSEDTSARKKKKDPKRESFVTWAAKIERWSTEERAKVPLADWDRTRTEMCIKMLSGVGQILVELKEHLAELE